MFNNLKFNKMKKLIFSGLLITLFSFSSQAKVTVIKRNAGTNGKYNYVSSEDGLFNKTLTCLNPGNILCAWSTAVVVLGNGGNVDSDDIIAYVESQVAAADYSGTDVKYLGTGIHVTWTYDDSADELVIEILDVNGL